MIKEKFQTGLRAKLNTLSNGKNVKKELSKTQPLTQSKPTRSNQYVPAPRKKQTKESKSCLE